MTEIKHMSTDPPTPPQKKQKKTTKKQQPYFDFDIMQRDITRQRRQ